jgi:hypothetical protein
VGAKFESERGVIIGPVVERNSGEPGDGEAARLQKGDSGSPGEPEAADTEDAGGEETRNRIGRVDGTSDSPGEQRVHFIETPENGSSLTGGAIPSRVPDVAYRHGWIQVLLETSTANMGQV